MKHLKIDKVIKCCDDCIYCQTSSETFGYDCNHPNIIGDGYIYNVYTIIDECPLPKSKNTRLKEKTP